MKLRVGDRFTTESGGLEVVGRPYSSAGGKMVYARVQSLRLAGSAVVGAGRARAGQLKRSSAEEVK